MKYLDLLAHAENKNLTVVLIDAGMVRRKRRFYRQCFINTLGANEGMYKITKRDYDAFVKAGADERHE